MTTKQRSKLRAFASKQDAVAQVGKEGLTEKSLDSLKKVLAARELIKINILKNQDEQPKTIANLIAEKLNAEVVTVMGNKVVIYKQSKKDLYNLNEI